MLASEMYGLEKESPEELGDGKAEWENRSLSACVSSLQGPDAYLSLGAGQGQALALAKGMTSKIWKSWEAPGLETFVQADQSQRAPWGDHE